MIAWSSGEDRRDKLHAVKRIAYIPVHRDAKLKEYTGMAMFYHGNFGIVHPVTSAQEHSVSSTCPSLVPYSSTPEDSSRASRCRITTLDPIQAWLVKFFEQPRIEPHTTTSTYDLAG